MRRFGKTSWNSLPRKRAGAVARASCRSGWVQRHRQPLAPRAEHRSQDPCPVQAGGILLLFHPQLLPDLATALHVTPVPRINKPQGRGRRWNCEMCTRAFLGAASGAAPAPVSSSSMFSPGVQLLATPLLQLQGWMFACPAHCLVLLVPLQVGTACTALPSAAAFSAGVVEGLERHYLQTAKWFVTGS